MIVTSTLHPAALLRGRDESGLQKFRDTCLGDIRRWAAFKDRRPDWDDSPIYKQDSSGRYVNLFPTVQEVFAFINRARGRKLTVDVETTGEQPMACQLICIGLGIDECRTGDEVLCVPILMKGGYRYWSIADQEKVIALLKFILSDPETPKTFQNGAFDTIVCWANGMPIWPFREDTLLAHHVVDGEMPHGLSFIGTTRLEVPYWKGDEKGKGNWLDLEDFMLRRYNCLHAKTSVILADGTIRPIKKLVQERYSGEVLTIDQKGHLTKRHVTNWYRQRVPGQTWRRIETISRGEMIVTPDHRVCVGQPGNWVQAKDVHVGDQLLIDEPEFTVAQRQALLGTILGDSNLTVSPVHRGADRFHRAELQCLHTNLELVRFKANALRAKISKPKRHYSKFAKTGVQICTLQTGMLYQLAPLRRLTYRGKTRRIPKAWLDLLGPRGWAWWFMDDGCLQKSYQRDGKTIADTVHLALCRYPKKDQETVADWIRKRFGRCSVQAGNLYFGREASAGFARFIGPHVIPSCRYKFPRQLKDIPAFSDSDLRPIDQRPLRLPVRVSEDWTPPHGYGGRKFKADAFTRYCIDVEDTACFFTPHGLVHNCLDVMVTARALPILLKELRQHKLEELYRKEVKLSQVMVRATVRGLLMDRERRDSTVPAEDGLPIGLGPRCRMLRDAALWTLRQIAGTDTFNPASQPQLQNFLFSRLGFPVVLKTEKDAPSTSKEALVLLALHAERPEQLEALKQLARWRKNEKILGTWIEGLPLLWDGRLHASFKLLPVTGRLSSSPNVQNLNKAIKRLFCAAPGNKYVGIDLSQAELRKIAHIAQDKELMRLYKVGANIHTVNATLVFGIRNPGEDTNAATEAYLEDLVPRALEQSYQSLPIAPKSKWKRIRHFAKTAVFAGNYGAVAETVFNNLRGERDPNTDELMFPDMTLGEVEVFQEQWRTLHPPIYQWWEDIQDEVHTKHHYRDPVSGRIYWFRAGEKMNTILNCLDPETEALTQRGWVKGFALCGEDVLLTKNAATECLEWQKVQALHLYPDYEGDLVELRSRSFSAIATPDHRWLAYHHKTPHSRCRTTKELNSMDDIHRTGRFVGREIYSDDVIKLCGWFLTDGSFKLHKRKRVPDMPEVSITQSFRANRKKVERIDALLERLSIKFHRYGPANRTKIILWRLERSVSAWLHDKFPRRLLTFDFMNELSGRQAGILLHEMMLGDGHLGGKKTFGASSSEDADLVQALATLAGTATAKHVQDMRKYHPTSAKLLNVPKGTDRWTVTLLSRDRVQGYFIKRRGFTAKLGVWCPTVPNGFFVVRREGQVFITGNCPIQGGIASKMLDATIEIDDKLNQAVGPQWGLVNQVHDALFAEVPDQHAKVTGEIMFEVLSKVDSSGCELPPDKPSIGDYFDEV